ncbi:MAG TPA: hypothetical protein VNO30_42645 [Kofleriaceae bacterium]|nr:hypothetical protein [Kofleriaceae bacterium]
MRRIATVLLLAACGGAPASQPASPATPTSASTATPVPAPAPAPAAKAAPASPQPLANQVPAPTPPRYLPIDTGDFGTAGPTLVRRVDPGERWMALCQARSDTDGDGKIEIHIGHHGELYGDQMDLYLVLGGGAGTQIEALAGASEDGRWLAIVRGGKVELVDAQTGEVTELRGADAQSDGRPGAPHRAAMFAKDRLLYIRHVPGGDDRIVVHDPKHHGEREITVPGRLWRIDYGPDQIAHVYTVPSGQTFPKLATTLGRGECIGPAMSYSTYGNSGPKPTERWIDLTSGQERAADGGEVAVGATIVRTPSDGALYFDGDQIAPPSCKAQLLAVLPSPVRVIAICGEKKQAKILLLGKGLQQELAAIDRETDHYRGLEGAIEPAAGVVCDAGLHCVATATNRYIDLKGGVAEHAWGSKLYVVHATMSSRKHEIIDVATGARAPIKTADVRLEQGKFIVDYDYNLVDIETGKILGKVPGAMRVSANGRVLRPAVAGQRNDKIDGPLRWSAP